MNFLKSQREYWNLVAGDKEFTTPLPEGFFDSSIPFSSKILDIGCGYGRTLFELYRMGYRGILGADFSINMIKRAYSFHNKSLPKLAVTESMALAFRDNSFDCVLLFAVLTCIHRDEDQEKTIVESFRVLKSGGWLIINDFLLNSDLRNIERYEKYQFKYGKYGVFETEGGAIIKHHTEAWIKDLTKDFETVDSSHFIFRTMNGNKSKGIQVIGVKP